MTDWHAEPDDYAREDREYKARQAAGEQKNAEPEPLPLVSPMCHSTRQATLTGAYQEQPTSEPDWLLALRRQLEDSVRERDEWKTLYERQHKLLQNIELSNWKRVIRCTQPPGDRRWIAE